jgi:hypothetical protein
VGVVFLFLPEIFRFGKLPGDIVYRRGSFTLYFAWVTSLIISIFLTLLFGLFKK